MYEYLFGEEQRWTSEPHKNDTASPSSCSNSLATGMEDTKAEADPAAEPVELIWENAHSRKTAVSEKNLEPL